MKAKQEIGNKYGRLTVISRDESHHGRHAYWVCRCDCGKEVVASGANLRRGQVRSCGCSRIGNHSRRHYDEDRGRLYHVWNGMKTRCSNPNFPQYKDYGGRGIKVCKEWLEYGNFLKWARETGYDDNAPRGQCTLDRIDNDGDYCPENCRWVTMRQQMASRRKRIIMPLKSP